jgi:hypothetical protein
MTVHEWFDENLDGEILLADGFDDALLGYSYSPGRDYFAVYDVDKCIQVLVSQGMDEDTAEEYFEFNVEGSGGKGVPVFVRKISLED